MASAVFFHSLLGVPPSTASTTDRTSCARQDTGRLF
ncbi:hypothetical protein CH63R_13447 [Colletotrichum higginsianum IMI 349063]|uniref:Uncharacterized protein n=1 Tax=Colletotrichum higginsianum (strain IMI 349063) TaxID=759273 RepID=A0A1B7XR45_COLHI|nr:hypothetical protein CH63R_13447 [Colletotrichum higginsianum IMI 349063]OBR02221.1 hypothetical protein CH63R_13447 [Colletotrichum higginsianum IMI 349063]